MLIINIIQKLGKIFFYEFYDIVIERLDEHEEILEIGCDLFSLFTEMPELNTEIDKFIMFTKKSLKK